jgi:hypothetical protein
LFLIQMVTMSPRQARGGLYALWVSGSQARSPTRFLVFVCAYWRRVTIEHRRGITLPGRVPRSSRPSPLVRLSRSALSFGSLVSSSAGAVGIAPQQVGECCFSSEFTGFRITDRKVSGSVPGCSHHLTQPLQIASYESVRRVPPSVASSLQNRSLTLCDPSMAVSVIMHIRSDHPCMPARIRHCPRGFRMEHQKLGTLPIRRTSENTPDTSIDSTIVKETTITELVRPQ